MSNISPPAPSSNIDMIGDLSEWTCDADLCGIGGPCDHCARRERVAQLLVQRGIERRPCTLDCYPHQPCERCQEVSEWLATLYQERDAVAILLRALRQVARVYPDEFREILAEPVIDIMEVRV